jgi:hypothetical protein
MMKVYRIQQVGGRGPFDPMSSTGQYMNEVFRKFKNTHPPIGRDISMRMSDVPWSFVCGCPSLEALADWFNYPDIVEVLERCRFVVRIYEMEDDATMYHGASGRQLMFDPHDAVAYVEKSISDIFAEIPYP